MKLSYKPYTLQLRHVFTVSSSSRVSTPIVLVEIEHEGIVGYGEASMPPYLGESVETVCRFLENVDVKQFNDPFLVEDILSYVDSLSEADTAAKAAIDIALHDLVGKLLGVPLYKLLGLNPANAPCTSFTIGIDTPNKVAEKTKEADEYKILKLKLGSENDRELVEAVRSVTSKPLYVDANQGWTEKQAALDEIYWLSEQGALMVEQPMKKERIDDIAWLTQHSPIPIVADEGIKRLTDLLEYHGAYTGVNVKLMKSTGIREGLKMIHAAKSLKMKTMIGCMTETSCAISAASHLSLLTDYADLDGALLVTNDIYRGTTFKDGRVVLSGLPGIGLDC